LVRQACLGAVRFSMVVFIREEGKLKRLSERNTREELIDPALEKAGWSLRNHHLVRIEIPVDGYDAAPWNGITDYCLYRPNGEVIAVVEAKRTTRDPRLAQQQAEHYVAEIAKHQSFAPFAFLTNGVDIYFLDSGAAAKRLVYGFFSPTDLERLLWLKQNRKPLASIPIDNRITDRAYQHEAIRRVGEGFENGKRKALVVMATGTGKTRTVMSLIDVFMRANQAQNILFVADRDELVKQAKTDGFEKYLPQEPCTRIYSHDIDTTHRLYAATLQTLSNCLEKFSPGFFDLVIFDEVHRSIFNKYSEAIQYFDAHMIGLTATPAQFIDRDTFRTFDCTDGKPTYLYTYQEAIDEHYLVDYSLYVARTKFQNFGIHGPQLSEEQRNSLIEQGLDPDDIDYEGTQLEKEVSNKDTLRKQWEELMGVCLSDTSGQLVGKTILFAMTQEHALRLQDVFDEMYPQWPELCRVITYKSEYRGQLMDHFKQMDQPRIAISVDMLDTGVDIPEVVNLVFMKPVQSRIKLEQMLGRGTRAQAACRPHLMHLLPNGEKKEFLVIDFWDNQFNRTAEEVTAQEMPVLVSLFNTRLKLLETYLNEPGSEEAQSVIADLREMIARLPVNSFTVKRALPDIEEAWQDSFWQYFITPSKLEMLRGKVAPLLRLAADVDVPAETFRHKVERLKLQLRTGKDPKTTVQSIVEDVSKLPDFVLSDAGFASALKRCTPDTLTHASTKELNEVREKLAAQMKHRRSLDNFMMLDLLDFIDLSGYIILAKSGEQVYVKEYRRRVEEKILALVEHHPVLQAIGRGNPVDEIQLLEVERALQQELGSGELEVSPANLRKVYGVHIESFLDLLKIVLDMDAIPGYAEIVAHQFQQFITGHNYNADQIRFMKAVQSVFVQKRRLALVDFYQEPLTNFGEDAVDRWFSGKEIDEMLSLTGSLSLFPEAQ
jgi:type I restriction enzyme, R subunit